MTKPNPHQRVLMILTVLSVGALIALGLGLWPTFAYFAVLVAHYERR